MLKVLNGNWGIFCKYSLVKKLKELKTHYGLHIYLGESDGTTTIPCPCHQGAQVWFLRCVICLCSLHFQVRALSDLNLKVLRKILSWLLLQKIMRSQKALTVRINTIDGEANWILATLIFSLDFFIFSQYFVLLLLHRCYLFFSGAMFAFQTSIH